MRILAKHLLVIVAPLVLIASCHKSKQSLMFENELVTPFPDEFLLYKDSSRFYYGIKVRKRYSINNGASELKISKLGSGVLGFYGLKTE